MIPVECPNCLKSYEVAEELAGKAAKCRVCGGRIPIPRLRTDSNAASERTRPVQPKPAPTNSPSPKALTPPPAKSKPTAKPKPTPKKQEDDFFEDDFEAIEDYDEVEEAEEDESPRQFHSTTRRSRSKKAKKKSAKISFGWLSSIGRALKTDVTGFALVLLGLIGFVGFGILLGPRPGMGMDQQAWLIFVGGISLVVVGNLWMTVKMWRIDRSWAYLFFASGCVTRVLSQSFPNNVVVAAVVLIVESLRFLALIWFAVENWSEVKAQVIAIVLGLCMALPPLFGNGGIGAAPVADDPAPAPAPGFQRAVPGIGRNVPAPRQNRVVQNSAVPIAAAQNASEQFQIDNIAIPEFENLSILRPLAQNVTNVMYGQSATKPGKQPGSQMQFAYYEPVGPHPPKSLPCVIMANGGTVLMSGIAVPSPSNDPETAQYIEAGFAVLGISLDGKFPDSPKPTLDQLRQAFSEFREAQAGLVNVRNGVEFLIQKVPQVDPNRLFVAGHSSAGTLALLAAAYEPRLKGCVAYCPASDSTALMKQFLNDARAEIAYPGITQFSKKISPISHVARMSCPIFLFHAADDPTIPVSDSRRLHQLLDSQGKRNTYVEVPTGGHDIAVIRQGIPSALQWLRPLAGLKSDAGTPATQVTPTNVAKSTVPKGAELPTNPKIVLPPNAGVPAGGVLQPSGRAVTFRFSTFSGKGDPTAAARQALRNVAWADLNDIEIDPATSEIRIGQLGGSVNSEPARQALLAAGFQLVGGVSIGAKKSAPSTPPDPTRPANTEPAAPNTSTSAENPSTTKSPPDKAASKPATPPVTESNAPKQSGPPRRVVVFRYERYSGKGSSTNAAVAALKKVKWADPDDVEVDAAKHEIRVGQLEESKEYEPAEKALTNAGFKLTPGVTSGLRKR